MAPKETLTFITINPNADLGVTDCLFPGELSVPIIKKKATQLLLFEPQEEDKLLEQVIDGIMAVSLQQPHHPGMDNYLKLLKAIKPNILDELLDTGTELAHKGKPMKALQYFRLAIRIAPTLVEAHYNLGACHLDLMKKAIAQGDYKQAAKHQNAAEIRFLKCIKLQTHFAPGYYQLGYFRKNQGDFIGAQKMWLKSLKCGINEPYRSELQNNLEKIKEMVEAQEHFERAVKCLEEKNFKQAIKTLFSLAKEFPEWWQVHFFIGLAYRETSQYELAVPHLKQVLVIQPDQVDAMNELGLCYLGLGAFVQAEEIFHQVIKIKPFEKLKI